MLGAREPIILTSRADSLMTRLASCAVAALVAKARRESGKAMGAVADLILVLNTGSSSIRFRVFSMKGATLDLVMRGQAEGLHTAPAFSAVDSAGKLIAGQDSEKGTANATRAR